MTETVAGVWHPVDVAVAHYAACDALSLAPSEQVEIGEEVMWRARGTVLATMLKLATSIGVTPWFMFKQSNRFWSHTYVGGGVAVVEVRPRRARIEIAGWPCATSVWCRNAMRGMIQASAGMFSSRAHAQEIPALCKETTLGYHVQWT
jgi:hypothetical protein